MNRIRIAIPALLAMLGVRKWLKERALHIPQGDLESVSLEAYDRAKRMAGGREPSPQDWWRAQESVVGDLIYDGIVRKVE